MSAKKPQEKVVGTLTVLDIPKMSPATLIQVGNWLRRVGDAIRRDPKAHTSGKFTARFVLPVGGKK